MDALREQMTKDLQLKGITPRTQKKYLREVGIMADYFDKPLEEVGEKELKDYLVHMLENRKISRGTYKTYVAGIKFLYKTTLNREEVVEKIRYPKALRKLPVVLDLAEVRTLLSVMENLKHRAFLTITYSAGLRVSEAAKLRVTDIDSKRMMVRVQQGKGGKDRYSILSQTALELLRRYWRQYRPKEWLFEGQQNGTHICYTAIRNIFFEAKKRAGIAKPASIHTLRHSFATHLILRRGRACIMSSCFWATGPPRPRPFICMSAR